MVFPRSPQQSPAATAEGHNPPREVIHEDHQDEQREKGDPCVLCRLGDPEDHGRRQCPTECPSPQETPEQIEKQDDRRGQEEILRDESGAS